jgi:uncharacterized integral membrane protein
MLYCRSCESNPLVLAIIVPAVGGHDIGAFARERAVLSFRSGANRVRVQGAS